MTLGWSYRFTERFVLDGNWMMRLAWGWQVKRLLSMQEELAAHGQRSEHTF